MTYGVIGEHLPHSFSKIIHEKIETYDYIIREIAKNDLDAFLRAKAFSGINVTIPYKEAVIPYLDEIDEHAKAIGAVNTIVNRGGYLYGYNTDFLGLSSLVSRLGLSLKGKKVLILGSGGTAKTAKALAEHEGAASVSFVSHHPREGVLSYREAYRDHHDADILFNTTPRGMFPTLDSMPSDENGQELELSRFAKLEGVVDVVYNPLNTRLVLTARATGIPAIGGLYMLVAQAVFAAEYFTGKHYPKALIDQIYTDILSAKENIVLIGMPASGKTTIGKALATLTDRRLVDTDDTIVAMTKKDIPTIFKEEGEDAFRGYESKVIADLAAENGLVIATGGGAVLKNDNVMHLKQNGRLYFLDRSLENLMPTADRPTASSKEAIARRFEERSPIYRRVADVVIDGDQAVADIADTIDSIHFHKEG